jgi:hypothetical protein
MQQLSAGNDSNIKWLLKCFRLSTAAAAAAAVDTGWVRAGGGGG